MSPWVGDENAALLTDFYELTMAAAYHATGAEGEATFDLFVRDLPAHRRFLVAAGIEDAVRFLDGWHFAPTSLGYLSSLGMFDPLFISYLGGLSFTGDVWAMPEGEVVFENEPILTVTAPLPQAQLVETFLLNAVGFQTMIASKAARVALACGDRTFIDFSARRDHGADSALKGARASYIGGAAATSMTLAGQAYGIPVTGTMAHSFVMSYEDEKDAFRDFARRFPANAVLLIDTYDTEEGARRAVEVADELSAEGISIGGVRLDSGDLGRLSVAVRGILDRAGQHQVQIFASGDLDEWKIAELVASGCPVDSFGVGTRMGTSADAPSLGVVYKLVADEGRPVVKLSTGKATLPGRKQVWRGDGFDVLGLLDGDSEPGRPLLRPVMKRGARTAEPEPLEDLRRRRETAVAALPERLRTLSGAERPYEVQLAPGLRAMRDETAAETP